MKTTIIALIFLLIGGVIGGFLAIGFGMSMGAAGGLIMGAQGGVCLAAKQAGEQGLGDQKALDQVVASAIAEIRAKSSAVPTIEWIEDAAGCKKLLEQFDKGPR